MPPRGPPMDVETGTAVPRSPVSVAVVPVVEGRTVSVVLVCGGCWRHAAARRARQIRAILIANVEPGWRGS